MKLGLLIFIFVLILIPCRSSDNVSPDVLPADAIFDPPKEMTVGIIKNVDATVYLTTITSGTFNVTPTIEAHLSGPAFSFSSVSPIEQRVTKEENATWKWYVTPLIEGNQTLILSIFNIDNSTSAQRWKAYERTIQVQVTLREFWAQLYNDNQPWLSGGAWFIGLILLFF